MVKVSVDWTQKPKCSRISKSDGYWRHLCDPRRYHHCVLIVTNPCYQPTAMLDIMLPIFFLFKYEFDFHLTDLHEIHKCGQKISPHTPTQIYYFTHNDPLGVDINHFGYHWPKRTCKPQPAGKILNPVRCLGLQLDIFIIF